MREMEKLLNSLEYLLEEKKILTSLNFTLNEYDELNDILIEILSSLYQSVKMNEIEKKVNQVSKVDLTTFKAGLKIIEDAQPKELSLKQSTEKIITITPSALINNIKDFIEEIESDERYISQLNILVRLELTMDADFERLLMTFDINNNIFNELKNLVLSKLTNIDNDEILVLWSEIRSKIKNSNNDTFYIPYEDVLPSDFLDSKSQLSTIRDKCAFFIVKYKPLIIKKMVEEGHNSFPISLPGVARILALPNNANMLPITKLETLLFRAMSQTIALYAAITHKRNGELSSFATAIGADPKGLICAGDIFREYREKLKDEIKKEDKYRLLTLNLKRLLEYSLLCTKQHIFIEDALWQYKLGQEVIAPRKDIEFDNNAGLELYLQKDLCKFLIERDILSFGRNFGRSQIDLYHKEIGGEDFIIEAKVYKNNAKLNLKELQKNLTQLQSYMDQTIQPKGILAIYNFTNDVILSPRKWLRGRIFIICINLCLLSPSKRKKSFEIVESETSIIDLVEIGN